MLYVARQAEAAAAGARTGADYNRRLVETVVGAPGLALFVEALSLTRRRQDLSPLIERTFERLHAEGDRAYADDPAGLRSLAVVFSQPTSLTEAEFEAAMWQRLQSLADKDDWQMPATIDDPAILDEIGEALKG